MFCIKLWVVRCFSGRPIDLVVARAGELNAETLQYAWSKVGAISPAKRVLRIWFSTPLATLNSLFSARPKRATACGEFEPSLPLPMYRSTWRVPT